jgi:hypothetical protein
VGTKRKVRLLGVVAEARKSLMPKQKIKRQERLKNLQNMSQQKRKYPRNRLLRPNQLLERNSRAEVQQPNSSLNSVEQNEESNPRYHRLETTVAMRSSRWNREGRETTLDMVLDSPGKLCYACREVVGWFDGHDWQKINVASLQALWNLLRSGEFVKIALIESGKPTGEDDDGVEGSYQ